VPVPSTAAALPAAPIARRLRRLMHFLLSRPETFRTIPKISVWICRIMAP
jgi:hypothetical protein